MQRVLEPELMEDQEQVQAYAQADFSSENQYFVDEFHRQFPAFHTGTVIDIGCGPADILIRLVKAFPTCNVIGIDASDPMIRAGQSAIVSAGVHDRIQLRCERIQNTHTTERADAMISNSVLHHFPNPTDFWVTLKRLAKPHAPTMVMDLIRPETTIIAQSIVEQYAKNEPEILRRDFYNSLLAAFTIKEIRVQLADAGLGHFVITQPDDRHWVACGRLAA